MPRTQLSAKLHLDHQKIKMYILISIHRLIITILRQMKKQIKLLRKFINSFLKNIKNSIGKNDRQKLCS